LRWAGDRFFNRSIDPNEMHQLSIGLNCMTVYKKDQPERFYITGVYAYTTGRTLFFS
jgi:hypothetical protein